MNYHSFSNHARPARQWFELGQGNISNHRFRHLNKIVVRRKLRRQLNASLKKWI